MGVYKLTQENVQSDMDRYFHDENLHDLIRLENELNDGLGPTAFPPKPEDLIRLHRIIRERKSFTVMEFGVGYSTIIIADALQKNEKEWQQLNDPPIVRNRFMFQLFSVDAESKWINLTRQILPSHLRKRVHITHSQVKIGTFNGNICHYYVKLPDIVPDFIYLDGPHPKSVKGNLNGLSFQCDERTVMGADILLMESILLPGTFILIDGRTNNARFLERHFSRNFKKNWDREGDITTFELIEDRLGPYNVIGSDFF